MLGAANSDASIDPPLVAALATAILPGPVVDTRGATAATVTAATATEAQRQRRLGPGLYGGWLGLFVDLLTLLHSRADNQG